MSYRLSKYTSNTIQTRGFSILEVLITAAIIGIITAVIVVRYGAFDNVVLLNSQAYELALDLRESQTLALSARGEIGEFREEYGLYFDIAEPNKYILFLDNGTANPALYDVGEELGVPYIIDARFEIVRICVDNCGTDVDAASVTFKRPDFDAVIGVAGTGVHTSVRIDIASVLDPSQVRGVYMSTTGQIDILNATELSGGS